MPPIRVPTLAKLGSPKQSVTCRGRNLSPGLPGLNKVPASRLDVGRCPSAHQGEQIMILTRFWRGAKSPVITINSGPKAPAELETATTAAAAAAAAAADVAIAAAAAAAANCRSPAPMGKYDCQISRATYVIHGSLQVNAHLGPFWPPAGTLRIRGGVSSFYPSVGSLWNCYMTHPFRGKFGRGLCICMCIPVLHSKWAREKENRGPCR